MSFITVVQPSEMVRPEDETGFRLHRFGSCVAVHDWYQPTHMVRQLCAACHSIYQVRRMDEQRRHLRKLVSSYVSDV